MSLLFIILFFKRVKLFLFGEPIQGEPIQAPKLQTFYPTSQNRLSESEWNKEVNFGSRYGHRGSFYQTNF